MLDYLDKLVARDHWPAIVRAAVFEGAFLLVVLLILGVPPVAAIGLIHLLTSIGGIFLTIVALTANARQQTVRAIALARRAVATLLLSGTTLLLLVVVIEAGVAAG